ncbi:MAG TPA: hypothetical protein VK469_14615 [Candidatus Kapabacteria bacterium]|nr:hypothetical protein [Candidatus Kapabacteria bacterium]
MKRIIFSILVFLLGLGEFIFGAKVATFPALNNPFYIIVDAEQLYITDGPTINIFSLKDYKPVVKFGRAGEGPQEFTLLPRRAEGNVNIFVHRDYILANSQGKVSYFSKSGKFLSERHYNSNGLFFQPLGKQFVGEGFDQVDNITFNIRNIYDADFKKGLELYRRKSFPQPDGKDRDPFHMISPIMRVYQDKVYINDAEELKILVFDSNGKKLPDISVNYDKLPVTEGDRQNIINWYKTNINFKDYYESWKNLLKFPKYFPAIRWFNVADDKIYVLTHKKEAEKSEFYIFDIKGTFLKKIMLPLKEKDERLWYPYTIGNGKLYQLIEDEDSETWELHVTDIK